MSELSSLSVCLLPYCNKLEKNILWDQSTDNCSTEAAVWVEVSLRWSDSVQAFEHKSPKFSFWPVEIYPVCGSQAIKQLPVSKCLFLKCLKDPVWPLATFPEGCRSSILPILPYLPSAQGYPTDWRTGLVALGTSTLASESSPSLYC